MVLDQQTPKKTKLRKRHKESKNHNQMMETTWFEWSGDLSLSFRIGSFLNNSSFGCFTLLSYLLPITKLKTNVRESYYVHKRWRTSEDKTPTTYQTDIFGYLDNARISEAVKIYVGGLLLLCLRLQIFQIMNLLTHLLFAFLLSS